VIEEKLELVMACALLLAFGMWVGWLLGVR